MKSFRGGVIVEGGRVRIERHLAGGQVMSRAYCDNVQPAINKLMIIHQALEAIDLQSESDASFYVRELMALLRPTYIELLPPVGPYQISHNLLVIEAYVRDCLSEFSPVEALQLLGCANMDTELHADCDADYSIDRVLPAKSRRKESPGDIDHIDVAAQRVRSMISEYIDMISKKKDQLQSAYLQQIDQIRQRLAE